MAGVGNTVLFTVFDPEQFGGIEHFHEETQNLADFVRGCPPVDENRPIQLPGDPERAAKLKRSSDGITVSDGTWDLIRKAASDAGVEV